MLDTINFEHGLLAVFSFFILALILIIFVTRDLLMNTIFLSLMSFLMASVFLILGSPDVAMTEAAVGACITTLLFLSVITIIGRESFTFRIEFSPISFILVFVTLVTLIIVCQDFPKFGYNNAPIHQYVAPYYYENIPQRIGIPSFVAAILASIRGYDTFGETLVIFTGAIGVLLVFYKDNKKIRNED